MEPNDELTSIPYRLTVDVISNELNTNTLLRRMDAIFSLHEESSEALVDFNTEFSSEPPLTYLEKVMFIQHKIFSSEVILVAFWRWFYRGTGVKYGRVHLGTLVFCDITLGCEYCLTYPTLPSKCLDILNYLQHSLTFQKTRIFSISAVADRSHKITFVCDHRVFLKSENSVGT